MHTGNWRSLEHECEFVKFSSVCSKPCFPPPHVFPAPSSCNQKLGSGRDPLKISCVAKTTLYPLKAFIKHWMLLYKKNKMWAKYMVCTRIEKMKGCGSHMAETKVTWLKQRRGTARRVYSRWGKGGTLNYQSTVKIKRNRKRKKDRGGI